MTGLQMTTVEGQQGTQGQQQAGQGEGGQGQASGEGQQTTQQQQQQQAPSWFEEATKFYTGKKTSLTADDEMGQELWKSVQEGNKIRENLTAKEKEMEGLTPYKTDIEWIMANPKLAPLVVQELQRINAGGTENFQDQGQQFQPDPNDPLQMEVAGLKQRLSAQEEGTIQSNLSLHLGKLQQQYPSMDNEAVKNQAIWQGAIYKPDAYALVEGMAKASHEKHEGLKQQYGSAALEAARTRAGNTAPSSAGGTATQPATQTFRSGFDKAWGEMGS